MYVWGPSPKQLKIITYPLEIDIGINFKNIAWTFLC